MSTRTQIDADEPCAICGKWITPGKPFVIFWSKKRAGVWHAACGPLPYIPGLTEAPKRYKKAELEAADKRAAERSSRLRVE